MFGRRKDKSMDVVEALAGHRAGQLLLVDVREADERAQARVPGSVHIPLGELKGRLGELGADRPVAFLCQSGRRSAMAATLARRGGLDARNVDGGMEAWARQGLDIDEGAA